MELLKEGVAIREIFLAKKLLTFLSNYHNKTLNQVKKLAFLKKFQNDKKYRESVIEQIVVLNDRFIGVEKSKILSNLFLSHINEKFNWEGFQELAQCLDNLNTRGFNILEESEKSQQPFYFKTYEQEKDGGGILFSAGICVIHGNHYSINAHGQYLYFYGIKGDIEYNFPKTNQ